MRCITSRQIAMNLAQKCGPVLPFLPDEFRNDREIVITALSTYAYPYSTLGPSLQSEREVALATASTAKVTRGTNMIGNITLLPDKFKYDRDFVIEYLSRNGNQLYGLDPINTQEDPILTQFFKDREIVLAAVRSDGHAIRFAPDELKNDPEMIKAVLQQNGVLLCYWSPKSRYTVSGFSKEPSDNKEYVVIALKSNPRAYEYASDRLQADLEIKRLAGIM